MNYKSKFAVVALLIFITACNSYRYSKRDVMGYFDPSQLDENTESYSDIAENVFKSPLKEPTSTFAIDVDGASYSNVRRFISDGSLPPPNAVRIEELINYFSYDYTGPTGDIPFSTYTEYSACPWNVENKLLHIGIQGKEMDKSIDVPSNLVFLLDVSGSMQSPDKLPLLKSSFTLLVDQLDRKDKVSIVVYAGSAGVVLPPTSGDRKDVILQSLDELSAGGSTAGGEGIYKAYQLARDSFYERGNNRVILATDGDFNVGPSSDSEMVELIEKNRDDGIFLSVLGFGTGNLKDSKMEKISNHGNGNYYYIDNLFEAKKVMVNELGGTLFTIAKDVKIQIEFNPLKVKSYRLLGYENRILNEEDFEDDEKDAGELGAGHTVTALYEIIPAEEEPEEFSSSYRYQSPNLSDYAYGNELASLKIRYKPPQNDESELIESLVRDRVVPLGQTSENFRFSAAVAQYGLLLRDSKFKAFSSYDQVVNMAKGASGEDRFGYRREFVEMADLSKRLRRTSIY